ncbi:MAG: CHAT domain-containing protein [Planctomycetes bacterium]|nr:CHAT domain-containing protein [Planctomycetota bacterium]
MRVTRSCSNGCGWIRWCSPAAKAMPQPQRSAIGALARQTGDVSRVGESAVAAPPAVLHISAHAVSAGIPVAVVAVARRWAGGNGGVCRAAPAGTAVVLSACNRRWQWRGQEGNVGLVEGAFPAGARAVVAPIAEINQQATADLMAQFHHRLAAGRGRCRGDGRGAVGAGGGTAVRTPHPHYWATFAVHGRGGSTTAATASACRWRWPWLLVLLAVAPVWSWWRRWRAPAPVGAGDQFHGRIV